MFTYFMAQDPRFATLARNGAPRAIPVAERAAILHAAKTLSFPPSHFADSSRKIIAHHTFVFSFVSSQMPYACYRHDDARVRKYGSCHTPMSFVHCLVVVILSSSDVEAF